MFGTSSSCDYLVLCSCQHVLSVTIKWREQWGSLRSVQVVPSRGSPQLTAPFPGLPSNKVNSYQMAHFWLSSTTEERRACSQSRLHIDAIILIAFDNTWKNCKSTVHCLTPTPMPTEQRPLWSNPSRSNFSNCLDYLTPICISQNSAFNFFDNYFFHRNLTLSQ